MAGAPTWVKNFSFDSNDFGIICAGVSIVNVSGHKKKVAWYNLSCVCGCKLITISIPMTNRFFRDLWHNQLWQQRVSSRERERERERETERRKIYLMLLVYLVCGCAVLSCEFDIFQPCPLFPFHSATAETEVRKHNNRAAILLFHSYSPFLDHKIYSQQIYFFSWPTILPLLNRQFLFKSQRWRFKLRAAASTT